MIISFNFKIHAKKIKGKFIFTCELFIYFFWVLIFQSAFVCTCLYSMGIFGPIFRSACPLSTCMAIHCRCPPS